MKKSFILLVAFVAMVFASCSKDDDDDPSNEVGSITMTLDEVDIDFVVGTAKDEIITIDWGDGLKQEYKSAMVEKDEKIQYNVIAKHAYAQSGTHPIKISGVVTGLWCEYYTELITLDVSKCRALKELYCAGNELTALDVRNNKALTYLDCGRNKLTSLDVSKCKALTELYCNNNKLTSLNLSECKALTELDCYNNKLTSLDVSECTALTDLRCYGNELTALDVSKCTALTGLYCSDNELNTLDVSKCTDLTGLSCGGNELTSLDVSKCTALTYLNCRYNSLSSDALNKIFNDLPKGKTWEDAHNKYQSKINIEYNPGSYTCDKSIFENKGWEISLY